MRNLAERHVEVTVDHAKRIFLRALEKFDAICTVRRFGGR
jgi:hypothetical protein